MKPEHTSRPGDNEPAGSSVGPHPLSADSRRILLELARQSLLCVTRDSNLPAIGEPLRRSLDLHPELREVRGCFVTLREHGGALRGCIGQVRPRYPLFQGVRENTRASALNDTRFEPVRANEAPGLNIEISVLSELAQLTVAHPDELIARLRPGVDGVFLTLGNHSATFLPQVWDHYPRQEDFLGALCQKAGRPRDAWRNADTVTHIYQAEHFAETP